MIFFFRILVTLHHKPFRNRLDMQEIKNISTYRHSLKDKILETSMTLFANKGINRVKMDDIANTLSISKRTIYEIYSDKEELLFEGVKKYRTLRSEHMRLISFNSDNVMDIILHAYMLQVEEFKRTNPVFYSDIERYPKVMRYLEDEHKLTRSEFLNFLHRGVTEGYFLSDINYELIMNMFDALGKYIMSNQLYMCYSMEDVFKNIVFVSLRGICTIKGVEVLDRFMSGLMVGEPEK